MSDYTNWPQRGDDRDQPWQDAESGVELRAGLPVTAAGDSSPAARELVAALNRLGYETQPNAGDVITADEMDAVRSFRRDYNVREDPSPWGGDNDYARGLADAHIGPWTGEAILRAADQADQQLDAGQPAEPAAEPQADQEHHEGQ